MEHVDLIVVGSGSSGGVVAARASEDADRRVLLLEAGPDFPDEATRTPLFTVSGEVWEPAGTPEMDWDFMNEEIPGVHPLPMPRGKVVGGSSMVNGCVAVRGAPADFDRWAAFGNRGWSWEDVLPYFIRFETDADFGDDEFHGSDGPIYIRRFPEHSWAPLNHAVMEAALGVGMVHAPDLNAPDTWAGTVGAWPQNRRNGMRMGTLVTYIREARNRPNFDLRADCTVDRVLFDGDRATGVRYIDAAGEPHEVTADLVVLAAGAYGTPAILQRSGIGPAEDLQRLGIETRADLPVGRHLLDHPKAGITIHCPPLSSLDGHLWAVNVRGPLGPEQEPEWHLASCPIDAIAGTGYVYAMLARHDSEGTVLITSSDPHAAPRIQGNFNATARDIERFDNAFAFIRELLEQPAFAKHGVKDLTAGSSTREILSTSLATGHHQCSTCKMGPAGDATAVVDDELRVHGFEGLMVADSSVFPDNVMFNTNLTCYMLGEVAADIVRGRRPAPAELARA